MAPGTAGAWTWEDVASTLAPARNYWLGTNARDGAPHAAPVWGVVADGHFYTYSERGTVKARNLARDDRAVLHLESAEHVVIVHGRMVDVGPPRESRGVVDALCAKYVDPGDAPYLPSSDEAFDVLYRLDPERALLWELADFDGSQGRWPGPPDSPDEDRRRPHQ